MFHGYVLSASLCNAQGLIIPRCMITVNQVSMDQTAYVSEIFVEPVAVPVVLWKLQDNRLMLERGATSIDGSGSAVSEFLETIKKVYVDC